MTNGLDIETGEVDFGVELSNAIMTAPRGRRSRTRAVQYWRLWTHDPTHKRHNWITVGPALSPSTAEEYTNFMETKYAEPLKQYGTYDGSNVPGRPNQSEIYGNATRFNPLIRQKGIKEMPKSQFVAYGWHRNPILAAMAPKSWKLDEVPEFVCEIDGRIFNTVEGLRKYTQVTYPESNAATAVSRELSGAITSLKDVNISAADIVEILKSQSEENAKLMAEVIAATLTATKEK